MITNPRWPTDTIGPRALVECEDDTIQDGLMRVLHEHGYTVAVCGGPQTRASRRCPLVTEGVCGLVDGADVVVHMLDAADAGNRTILSSIRALVPETPVVVEVAPAHHDGSDGVVAGCEQVGFPMTREALVAALDRAHGR